MEEVDEDVDGAFAAEAENPTEDFESLSAEGDDDAVFISDFENAASEVIQADEDFTAAFNSYTDARKRLNEKDAFSRVLACVLWGKG